MIDTHKFNSLLDVINTFSDEQTCIDHLTSLRWNGNIISPFDSTSKVYVCKGNKYKCKNTGKYFNVRTGTFFDNTKVKLQKWFLAMYLITSHKKGISSIQLGKDIGVTQKTAWFMLQRIRVCFGINDDDKMEGEVQIDETYVGGNEKNKHANKRSGRKGVQGKTPVLGMISEGKVNAEIVPDNKRSTLEPKLISNIAQKSVIVTDMLNSYVRAGKYFSNHVRVNHTHGEYVLDGFHTNSIEGFWSLLKRGIIGIYHSTSKKHLQKYVNEFTFRYNTRELSESERMNALLNNFEIKTTYKNLIHG